MVNFIYLAHSQERFRKQTVFSILSLLEFLKASDLKFRIVVYSDQPEYFECLGVEREKVSPETLADWKGANDFVHRTKICVLFDAAKKFEGRLMFLDSDNCLHTDPTNFLKGWGDDTVILEKLEYILEKPADLVGRKYKRFFRKQHHFAGYDVLMNQECWNSGIIGLPSTSLKLLPSILKVCDEMHRSFPKHLSEQMAFSIVLSHHYKVVAFKQYTYHWFGHGHAINKIIDRVLADYPDQALEKLIENVSAIKQEVITAPLNRDKQPWYKRWFK